MLIDQRRAYTEIIEILKELDVINKIPQDVLKKMEDNKDKEWDFKIDKTLPISEQNILYTTKSLYTALYINYICNNDNTKKEILKICGENSKKKYNAKNMFNKKEKHINNPKSSDFIENNNLIEKPQTLLDKIKSFLKSFFKL